MQISPPFLHHLFNLEREFNNLEREFKIIPRTNKFISPNEWLRASLASTIIPYQGCFLYSFAPNGYECALGGLLC
jgi:hypothetical protein